MEIEKYYLNLKTQQPINYDGLIIYQPSFDEIMNYGVDLYNQIMLIYSLTLDCFDKLNNKDNINLFDLILNDQYLLNCLSESLYMLTKADGIVLYEQLKTVQLKFINNKNDIEEDVIEKTFDINSTNFDDISNIILKINAKKKVEIEKPPANMSPRQKDVWEKLQEGRQRDAKKNEIHIYDILNICEFGGEYYIPISEICSWSLWRIMNCYKSRINWKSYDDNLQIALVSGDSKNISGKNHWHHQLMIRE